jgi:CBS domain-containing protein
MDGGRVLRALLAMWLSYARATQIAASCGQAIAFLFGFLGLFFNPMLIFIAIFIYLGAAAEARHAQLKEVSTGLLVNEAMMTHLVTLPTDAPIDQAVEALLRTAQHEFPVMDSSGELVGILTRDNIIRGLKEANVNTSVSSLMHQNIPVVQHDASFDQAFQKMQECQCPGLGVVDREGKLIGLITPEAVGEMMMVLSLSPRGTQPSWRQQTPARA